jgi:sialate O-acetylesterase
MHNSHATTQDGARLLSLLTALLAGTAAQAAPVLDPLFGDHAVLQRGRPIAVRGTADPGERVTVTLGAATGTGQADRAGRWRIELPAMAAGGPHRVTATGANGASDSSNDILVGDVWLCSGQSNMEWPLRRSLQGEDAAAGSADPQLRLLTVARNGAREPQRTLDGATWQAAAPETARDFSAACYFMVRALRASQNVPIGAIAASWGGTQVRAWTDADQIAAIGDQDARLFALYQRDPVAAEAQMVPMWQRWWREQARGAAGAEPWIDSSRLAWTPVPAISLWENWGGRLANFDGMIWFRKRFTLTAAEAARGATLELGAIDDMDRTWVNGRPVGGSGAWDALRRYRIAPGLLRAGENEIIVNAYDGGAGGGFAGPAERLRLVFEGGATHPLGEDWHYSIVEPNPGAPPGTSWDFPTGFTWLYNGMIAPLGDVGLTGVAWYQGEADVGQPGSYADRLAAMMTSWRRQFRAPDLPFLIVSLANFGAPQLRPQASGWAALREQQRLAVRRDPRAALVIAMDLGERDDIHPGNKVEVGRRLARAARRLAYGGSDPVGPEAVRARRSADGIVVEFGGVTGALRSWSGTRALAIELCAETQDSCRYADAVADGTTLRIAGDGRPATRVRHGWADAPVTNLYDEAPLPVGPFELPID